MEEERPLQLTAVMSRTGGSLTETEDYHGKPGWRGRSLRAVKHGMPQGALPLYPPSTKTFKQNSDKQVDYLLNYSRSRRVCVRVWKGERGRRREKGKELEAKKDNCVE